MTDRQHSAILQRLSVLESGHAEIMRKLEEMSESEEECRRHLNDIVIGNGRPGLMTRVDRLEQISSTKQRYWALMIAAVITCLVDTAVRWIRGH